MSSSRKILKNIFSLTVSEIACKGLTIVYTVYLARILSVDGYGVLGFAKSLTAILVLLNTLGFESFGTREIARKSHSIPKLVNSIITLRFILSIIIYSILLIVIFFLNNNYNDKLIILIIGSNVFSSAFLLNWVFIGTEKMEIPAMRQIVISILNFVGIFIFVKNPNNTMLAACIIASNLIISSGWIIVYYITNYGKIKFQIDIDFWKIILKSAIPIGLGTLIAVINNNLNTLLLGIMHSNAETGIFTASMNIFNLVILPTGILQFAFYPNISRCDNLESKQKITEKYSLLAYLIGAILILGAFTYSDWIVSVFGAKYAKTESVVQILLISSALIYMNVIFGITLLAFNKEKIYLKILFLGGIFDLLFNLLFIPSLGAKGSAIASVINEFIVTAGFGYFFFKIINKTYIFIYLKLLLIACASCLVGYYLRHIGVWTIASIIITFLMYITINFLMKTVTISEIKSYLKKPS